MAIAAVNVRLNFGTVTYTVPANKLFVGQFLPDSGGGAMTLNGSTVVGAAATQNINALAIPAGTVIAMSATSQSGWLIGVNKDV